LGSRTFVTRRNHDAIAAQILSSLLKRGDQSPGDAPSAERLGDDERRDESSGAIYVRSEIQMHGSHAADRLTISRNEDARIWLV
jgi:hypothetical protein